MGFRSPLLLVLLLSAPVRAEDHWAYLPVKPVELQGDGHPVDRILEKHHREAGLATAPLAAPRQWVERAAYTLTGLPPSPAHLERIARDPSEKTWQAIIDELLASSAYGERWARHWMDVARYADTRGYAFGNDNRYPYAYTYRRWLIDAFNQDLPYPRFVQLQIAADLLTEKKDDPDLAALGFLTVGLRSGRVETIDDRVDVVTRGFLASTVSCARCHDHKTDPISTEDYYSLFSIFANTDEPEEKPVIGNAPSEEEYQDYLHKRGDAEQRLRARHQELVDHMRDPAVLAGYLALAWQARHEKWDNGKITSESAVRGRYRAAAVTQWRKFIDAALNENSPALHAWAEEMSRADQQDQRLNLSQDLANQWTEGGADHPLRMLFAKSDCPLSYEADRVGAFRDTKDNKDFDPLSKEIAKLDMEHAGAPPRAMTLADRENWEPARVFHRGNPDARGEPFERHWLSFLGGGAFPEGQSPRLSLAQKITDPANPLTARVMVNRVWAWHFGQPIQEPGDFGPQLVEPKLRDLLDTLTDRFAASGGSLKQLHRLILSSKAFRLQTEGPAENLAKDEGNTLFWKWNRQRVDFESMRDRLLATAGALDLSRTGARSINLDLPEADAKRSIYAFIDRYALPTTFVSFDLPHPDLHSPKRVETTVPQQALYFLNGRLPARQADRMTHLPEFTALSDDPSRLRWVYQKIHRRDPTAEEAELALSWIHGADAKDYQPRLDGDWQVLYAPAGEGTMGTPAAFPLFENNTWKTGPDLAHAPVPWLNASAKGGHPSSGHALILRWTAASSGFAKLTGNLSRNSNEGATIAWRISNGETVQSEAPLPPGADTRLEGVWTQVSAGDSIDFVLLAPQGDHSSSVKWQFHIEGRDSEQSSVREIGNFEKQFPTPTSRTNHPAAADPWSDLIQMIWASNEFHYID